MLSALPRLLRCRRQYARHATRVREQARGARCAKMRVRLARARAVPPAPRYTAARRVLCRYATARYARARRYARVAMRLFSPCYATLPTVIDMRAMMFARAIYAYGVDAAPLPRYAAAILLIILILRLIDDISSLLSFSHLLLPLRHFHIVLIRLSLIDIYRWYYQYFFFISSLSLFLLIFSSPLHYYYCIEYHCINITNTLDYASLLIEYWILNIEYQNITDWCLLPADVTLIAVFHAAAADAYAFLH